MLGADDSRGQGVVNVERERIMIIGAAGNIGLKLGSLYNHGKVGQ